MEFIDQAHKGRGVIACESIAKGDFICEYKYDESYPKREKKTHDEEYAINEEGCFTLECQLPYGLGWICLDPTRNPNCWARYFNHAHPTEANMKLFRPLMVRQKWRVGFIASKEISKGDELLYDYGSQSNAPSWLRRRKVILLYRLGDPPS